MLGQPHEGLDLGGSGGSGCALCFPTLKSKARNVAGGDFCSQVLGANQYRSFY